MSNTENPTRLVVVRHGHIEANSSAVWHGSTDSPLTELGRTQARQVADFVRDEFPNCSALYTSPLERARHTAEAIGRSLGADPIHDAGLAEWGIVW